MKINGGPLAVRNFRLLSAGQFASTIGDYCYAIAMPWYVLSSHGSTILLGTVLACYGVPRMVLIPVGGVLADRFSPRTVMLIADSMRCVLVAVLVVLASRHSVSLAYLGPTGALIGAGEGLFIPASFAILPSLLDGSRLVSGNGLFSAFQQTGSLVGPAVGGVVVSLASPALAFGVDAASFGVSALTLALITRRVAAAAARAGSDGSSGGEPPEPAPGGVLRLLRASRILQVCLMIMIAANLTSAGLSEIALPALSHQRYAASGYGALLCCIAGGSIIGSLAATRSGELRRPAVVASLVFIVEGAATGLAPFFGGLPVLAAGMALLGLCNGLGNSILSPRMQAWAPPEMLGRVMSVLMLGAFGSAPVSVLVTGLIVHRFGAVAFFPIAGCFVAVTLLAALASREWRGFGARLASETTCRLGGRCHVGANVASTPNEGRR
jgi:MFS family permease